MIGIFGGTFDPVHDGHLGLARTAYEEVGLDRVIFVPLGVAPHRDQPHASAALRVQMLEVAVQSFDQFEVDTVEIEKPSPSWTIETLEHFSQLLPGEILCLLMGSDAFKSLNTWHQWRSITQYCHIIYVNRVGDNIELSQEVADFLEKNRLKDVGELSATRSGGIYNIEADIPGISSSEIRQKIASGLPVNKELPGRVMEIIMNNGLYQDG